MMSMEWPYFTLTPKGMLRTEDGVDLISPEFRTVAEAEQWLVDNDIRGSVR